MMTFEKEIWNLVKEPSDIRKARGAQDAVSLGLGLNHDHFCDTTTLRNFLNRYVVGH